MPPCFWFSNHLTEGCAWNSVLCSNIGYQGFFPINWRTRLWQCRCAHTLVEFLLPCFSVLHSINCDQISAKWCQLRVYPVLDTHGLCSAPVGFWVINSWSFFIFTIEGDSVLTLSAPLHCRIWSQIVWNGNFQSVHEKGQGFNWPFLLHLEESWSCWSANT